MAKKTKNRNPVHIPNQSYFNHSSGYLYGLNEGTVNEMKKEHEFQKKLALRKK